MEFCYSKDHCRIICTLFEDKGTLTSDKGCKKVCYLGYDVMLIEPALWLFNMIQWRKVVLEGKEDHQYRDNLLYRAHVTNLHDADQELEAEAFLSNNNMTTALKETLS